MCISFFTSQENHRRHDDSEALGILGYMRSLVRSCLEEKLIDRSIYEREIDWISGMKDSFAAQHERIQTKHDRLDAAGQIARQWTGIILAYTSLSALLWVSINKGVSPSKESEGFLFELLSQDWPYIAGAYLFCLASILTITYLFKFVTLLDRRPSILKSLFKMSYTKFLLYWLCSMIGVIALWYHSSPLH